MSYFASKRPGAATTDMLNRKDSNACKVNMIDICIDSI